MVVPENIIEMCSETRKKTIKFRFGSSNWPHIMDQIYNHKYYQDKKAGFNEVYEAVSDESFGIIIEDFRSLEEKSEFSQNQWICIYFSRLCSRVFCVPIAEGNDFLELLTIHHANSDFRNAYWKLHEEKLKLKR